MAGSGRQLSRQVVPVYPPARTGHEAPHLAFHPHSVSVAFLSVPAQWACDAMSFLAAPHIRLLTDEAELLFTHIWVFVYPPSFSACSGLLPPSH